MPRIRRIGLDRTKIPSEVRAQRQARRPFEAVSRDEHLACFTTNNTITRFRREFSPLGPPAGARQASAFDGRERRPGSNDRVPDVSSYGIAVPRRTRPRIRGPACSQDDLWRLQCVRTESHPAHNTALDDDTRYACARPDIGPRPLDPREEGLRNQPSIFSKREDAPSPLDLGLDADRCEKPDRLLGTELRERMAEELPVGAKGRDVIAKGSDVANKTRIAFLYMKTSNCLELIK